MQPRRDRPAEQREGFRRWGPIAAVMVVIIGIAAVAFGTSGGGGKDRSAPTTTTPIKLPTGVITSSMAKQRHLKVTFPKTCDTRTGRIAIPFIFRSECFADVKTGGGSTARGVTKDTIKVVAWLPAKDDAVRALLLQRIGFNASNDDLRRTYKGFADIFQRYYQTYGRKVELQFLEASGSILDNTAARADAVRAADEMGAFAVLGGPLLGSAWTDELHARGVVCIACPGTSEAAPTVFSIPPTAGQIETHLVNYTAQKLAGGTAKFAGPDLQGKQRVFGQLSLGSGDSSDKASAADSKKSFAEKKINLAAQIVYPLDPGRAAELATSGIAKMQAAGVTTVLVDADPILLPAFTQEATKQRWFPEWVLGGSPFVDTTVFARTFDPDQWKHAFGISYFPPQVEREANPPIQLYKWFHGEPPPVQATIPLLLIYPQVVLFFTGLEYAGPHLTAQTFRNGMFQMPPTMNAVTQPSVSYGKHRWQGDDYAGVDDMVELWWDPKAKGPDEAGERGQGMYRYVDGGRRFLPDDWTKRLDVFQTKDAPTIIKDIPARERPPRYPAPSGGG